MEWKLDQNGRIVFGLDTIACDNCGEVLAVPLAVGLRGVRATATCRCQTPSITRRWRTYELSERGDVRSYPRTLHECPDNDRCAKYGTRTCALCDDCGPPGHAAEEGGRFCEACGRRPQAPAARLA